MSAPSEEQQADGVWWHRLSITGGVVMMGLWILLSGKIDAFHLGTGAIAVLVIGWKHARLPRIQPGSAPQIQTLRAIGYGFWLIWEAVKAAVYVAKVIINPDKLLDPRIIRFESPQPSLYCSVLLANSITLTPGTITVDLEENRYTVHALTPATAKDVLDGGMAARVARLSTDEPIALPTELSPSNGTTAS